PPPQATAVARDQAPRHVVSAPAARDRPVALPRTVDDSRPERFAVDRFRSDPPVLIPPGTQEREGPSLAGGPAVAPPRLPGGDEGTDGPATCGRGPRAGRFDRGLHGSPDAGSLSAVRRAPASSPAARGPRPRPK